MLVIDASALVEVLTVDPDDIAELGQRVHDVEWMSAPELIDYEVLNVLRKMLVRGDIDAGLAEDTRMALRDLRLSRHVLTDELTDRMWELRDNTTTYDAAYVALAEQLGMPLVTGDARLGQGLQAVSSITVERYVSPIA